MASSAHAFREFLGRTIYSIPDGPPRKRTKPLEVICVGPPRSGTESLQKALSILGYDYTYHGWDILFEEPLYLRSWARIANKKWYGTPDGDHNITRADLDSVTGHAAALTDAPSNCFAAEYIELYPEAKVIINTRDLDKWHASAVKNLCATEANWYIYWTSWWTAEAFWSWHIYYRLLWPWFFRCGDYGWGEWQLDRGILRNGKWIYREHCDMVRGLLHRRGEDDRALEWTVDDGWEPLCKFLGKEVPKEPFPNVNNAEGFGQRVVQFFANNDRIYKRNTRIASAILALGVASCLAYIYT